MAESEKFDEDVSVSVRRIPDDHRLSVLVETDDTRIEMRLTPEQVARLAGGLTALLGQLAAECAAELREWVRAG